MKLGKKIFISLIACLWLLPAAYAAVTSESYSIKYLNVTGGGGSLYSDSYRVLDLKGQNVISNALGTPTAGNPFGSLSYTQDLGGLYGELGARGWAADGNIRDIRIYTSGGDVQLTWVPRSDGRCYVYRLAGPFSSEAIYWPDGIDAGLGDGGSIMSWTDIGQNKGGSPEIYYRISSSPNKADISDLTAYGKVNITLAPGDNLVSFPFVNYYPYSYDSMKNILADLDYRDGTFQTADIVFEKRSAAGMAYNYAYQKRVAGHIRFIYGTEYGETEFDSASYMRVWPNIGYFVRRQGTTPETITVCGQLSTEAYITLYEGYNLIGSSFPKRVRLTDSGYSRTGFAGDSRTADTVYKKQSAAGYGYDGAYLGAAETWYDVKNVSLPSTMEISHPYGYFYWRRSGARPVVVHREIPRF